MRLHSGYQQLLMGGLVATTVALTVFAGFYVTGRIKLDQAKQEYQRLRNLQELSARAEPIADSRNAAPIWQQAFEELLPSKGYLWDPDFDLQGLVNQNRRMLELAHEAASRPDCLWPTAENHLYASTPFAGSAVPGVAHVLCAEAIVRARAGDLDGSVDSLATALTLADHMGRNPSTSALIFQITADNTILITCMELGDLYPLPTERLNELIRRRQYRHLLIRSIASEADLILEQERAGTLADYVREGEVESAYKAVESGDWSLIHWQLVPGTRHRDLALLLRTYCEAIRLHRIVYYNQPMAEEDPPVQAPEWAVYTRMLGINTYQYNLSIARAETHIALARTAFALRQHKQRIGSYPETLAPLDAPVSPITGQPVYYRREGKGFILTSPIPSKDVNLEWRWTR